MYINKNMNNTGYNRTSYYRISLVPVIYEDELDDVDHVDDVDYYLINEFNQLGRLISEITSEDRHRQLEDEIYRHTLQVSMDEYKYCERKPQQLSECFKVVEKSDSFNCSVCLENEDRQVISLNACNHQFHYDCINEWVKYNAKCPVCRTDIQVETLDTTKNK
jgi:hypothetical protein